MVDTMISKYEDYSLAALIFGHDMRVCVFMEQGGVEVLKLTRKRQWTWPMSSHLVRTRLVNNP